MSINIRRDNDDPFYRYKMPPIQSKVQGSGNGVKTSVINTSDVARALNRPPSYIIKYFGFELGAQTSINEDADRYIVNGIHEPAKLQDTLDGFINKFVLCGSCKNPETDFVIHRNGLVEKDCKACGVKSLVDPQHKLSAFIVKNPPQKSKKKGMANAGAATTANDGEGEDEAGQEERASSDLTSKINAEAAVLPEMKETNDEDEEWAADVSEEAVKARQKQADRAMNALSIDDEDNTPDSVYEEFGNWVINEHPSDIDIYKRMAELGMKPKAVQVLAQALLTSQITKDVVTHGGLFAKVTPSPAHEKALLGGIERLIGLQHPELVKEVPNVLFKLYDADIISEDVVTKWGTKASKRYVPKDVSKKVRKAAKPFIEWLEEASSDESDDSE